MIPLSAQTDRAPLDNEYVRVTRGTEQPGRKGPAHDHENNRIRIFLDAGQSQFTSHDGKVTNLKFKAGDVSFDPAVKQHTSENTGKEVFHQIEVELKKPGSGRVTYPANDPLKVEPGIYTVLIDNPQVRVLRAHYAPGAKAAMHHHLLKRVSVMLSPQHVAMIMGDGSKRESHRAVGEVVWGPDLVIHSEENIGKEPYEAILVELK